MCNEDFKTVAAVTRWKDLIEIESTYADPTEEWVFRGDSCVRALQPTLERLKTKATGDLDARKLESQFISDFQRSFRIYAPVEDKNKSDILYWLSLMRHYGTPTRLLDFTYSFFVATFFALENQGQTDAVVWLISKTWLTRHNVKAMFEAGGEDFCRSWGDRMPEAFDKIFFETKGKYKAGVFPLNPAASHQRLHLQQGLFLSPVSLDMSFSDNLKAYSRSDEKVLKVLIRRVCRDEILLKLHRAGTNRELLFPGLDGFAQGLQSRTPITHSNLEKLSNNGARVPTDSKGKFLWADYYNEYCRDQL